MYMFVSNLGLEIQDEDLKQLFAVFGEVISAKVVLDERTRHSRGFGFVEMSDQDGANAMSELHNKAVNGRTLSVALAKQKPKGTVKMLWI